MVLLCVLHVVSSIVCSSCLAPLLSSPSGLQFRFHRSLVLPTSAPPPAARCRRTIPRPSRTCARAHGSRTSSPRAPSRTSRSERRSSPNASSRETPPRRSQCTHRNTHKQGTGNGSCVYAASNLLLTLFAAVCLVLVQPRAPREEASERERQLDLDRWKDRSARCLHRGGARSQAQGGGRGAVNHARASSITGRNVREAINRGVNSPEPNAMSASGQGALRSQRMYK